MNMRMLVLVSDFLISPMIDGTLAHIQSTKVTTRSEPWLLALGSHTYYNIELEQNLTINSVNTRFFLCFEHKPFGEGFLGRGGKNSTN